MFSEAKYTTVGGVIEKLVEKFPNAELPSLSTIPLFIANRKVAQPVFINPWYDTYNGSINLGAVFPSWPPLISPIVPIDYYKEGTDKPDTIVGTDKGRDFINGLKSDDLLFGLGEADIILGEDGSDIIFDGAGNDFVFAGNDDDFLFNGSGNDYSLGGNGDDSYFAGKGTDVFRGGAGTDTADYNTLGQGITLLATGNVNKGFLGSDQLSEVEVVKGAAGLQNTIDAGNAWFGSINVNLLTQSATFSEINRPQLSLKVENFTNVEGSVLGDTIVGDNGDNLLNGNDGDDLVVGLGGDDTVNGGQGDDRLAGGYSPLVPAIAIRPIEFDGNDLVNGGDGNDVIEGGGGEDIIDGGSGLDTADYSNLSQGITLRPFGLVDKGKLGTDRIRDIETIIGSSRAVNTIDASSFILNPSSILPPPPPIPSAAINVDLSAGVLNVVGLPQNLKFTVKNFANVVGSFNNDIIIGDSKVNQLSGDFGNDDINAGAGDDVIAGGTLIPTISAYSPSRPIIFPLSDGSDRLNGEGGDDTFQSGTGFDTIDGGKDFDTVDYSGHGQAITLRVGETQAQTQYVSKGFNYLIPEVDTLTNIERVIGATKEANTINGYHALSLSVNLATNELLAVTATTKEKLLVENFVNVTGSAGDDNITGNKGNNVLVGNAGSDQISGEAGKDIITGVNPYDSAPGFKEEDVLLGGADGDTFILGDEKNAYYVGGNYADKAILRDFKSGEDNIVLNGSFEDYFFLGSSNTEIYRKVAFSDALTRSPGDLVAEVNGSIAKSDLIFVSEDLPIA